MFNESLHAVIFFSPGTNMALVVLDWNA